MQRDGLALEGQKPQVSFRDLMRARINNNQAVVFSAAAQAAAVTGKTVANENADPKENGPVKVHVIATAEKIVTMNTLRAAATLAFNNVYDLAALKALQEEIEAYKKQNLPDGDLREGAIPNDTDATAAAVDNAIAVVIKEVMNNSFNTTGQYSLNGFYASKGASFKRPNAKLVQASANNTIQNGTWFDELQPRVCSALIVANAILFIEGFDGKTSIAQHMDALITFHATQFGGTLVGGGPIINLSLNNNKDDDDEKCDPKTNPFCRFVMGGA